MRIVTAYDLGVFAAQRVTQQKMAQDAWIKRAADEYAPLDRSRPEVSTFVVQRPLDNAGLAARNANIDGLQQQGLNKLYGPSNYTGFRLKPVQHGLSASRVPIVTEYQVVATGPDGGERVITNIKSTGPQSRADTNPSNINRLVEQAMAEINVQPGPKPRPRPQPAPAPAAPAPAAQAPAPAAQAPAPAAPAPAPVAPATPPPAPAQPDQIGPTAPITTDNALGGPTGGQPSPPEPEPASAPTPATLDPFKITQLGSSLVTPETRTKVNPGWPTPRTTALSDYHEANPKLRRNGPAMYADPSEQYHADMLNNNLMPRVDTWEQQPDGSFRSDNTEQSHAYAQPTLRMADEIRREQAAVGNNPADYPEQVPAAPPEPESSIVSSRDVSRESAPLDPLPGVDDSILPSPSINDLGFSDPSYVPPTATPTAEPTYGKKRLTPAQRSVGNVGAFSEAGVAKTRTINDLGFADANYVPPPATPTSEPTYGKKPLTPAQRSVGNVGAFSEAGVAKTRKEDQRKAKLAPAPATAAPTAPSVPVTPPQPPIPTPEQPKPTPPPVPPPAPKPTPTPAPAAPQYRPSAPAAPAYRPPAQAAPAPRQTIGGGLFGRRRR